MLCAQVRVACSSDVHSHPERVWAFPPFADFGELVGLHRPRSRRKSPDGKALYAARRIRLVPRSPHRREVRGHQGIVRKVQEPSVDTVILRERKQRPHHVPLRPKPAVQPVYLSSITVGEFAKVFVHAAEGVVTRRYPEVRNRQPGGVGGLKELADRLWTQKEAAYFLGVSARYLRDSDCPKVLLPGNGKKGQSLVRYDPADVRAWAQRWNTRRVA